MTNSDAHAHAYVERFWNEKPEPIKNMIGMAYIAGTNDLRGQAAIAALQGLLSNPECIGSFVLEKEKESKPISDKAAEWAISFANALVDRLNTPDR